MRFEVKNGSFSYKAGTPVLQDVSFSIQSGQVLSILGPNGVGKTTLLRCMMGMLRWSGGGSFLDGENIADIPHQTLWKRIAYVPQAKTLPFAFSVEEMILMGRSAHTGLFGNPGQQGRALCRQAMEAVGIGHMKDRYCNQISGGELQMVLIARALCTQPAMLILDEPESNLDFRNQLIILNTIERLSKQDGLCCIFNTHYPAHALKISDQSLLLLRQGESIFGPAQNVVNAENMRDIFQVNVDIKQAFYNDVPYRSVTAISLA